MKNESQTGIISLGTKIFYVTLLGLMVERILAKELPSFDRQGRWKDYPHLVSIAFKQEFTEE